VQLEAVAVPPESKVTRQALLSDASTYPTDAVVEWLEPLGQHLHILSPEAFIVTVVSCASVTHAEAAAGSLLPHPVSAKIPSKQSVFFIALLYPEYAA
jgi:hypothetical protein